MKNQENRLQKWILSIQAKNKKKACLFVKKTMAALLSMMILSMMPLMRVSAQEETVSELMQPSTPSVRALVNGKEIPGAFLSENTTFVPIRMYCSVLQGSSVEWDQKTATAIVKTPYLEITIPSDSHIITANGRIFYSEVKTCTKDGTLYVPIRSLAAATGGVVSWDGETMTATVLGATGNIMRAELYYDQNDLYWLSRIIHAESQGEPLKGKIAVGCVILNRVESDEFPNTIYGVIFDRKFGVQFTPTATGSIYNTPNEESVQAAKICLEGYTLSKSIKYFINEKLATNTWVVYNRPYAQTIGNHDFYS